MMLLKFGILKNSMHITIVTAVIGILNGDGQLHNCNVTVGRNQCIVATAIKIILHHIAISDCGIQFGLHIGLLLLSTRPTCTSEGLEEVSQYTELSLITYHCLLLYMGIFWRGKTLVRGQL